MRIRSILLIVAVLAATPLLADETKIYSSYETARQALIKISLPEIQSATKQLAANARDEKQPRIAARADALAKANDIAVARTAFAALSEEVIKFRASGCCERPVVVYCSMEQKFWLQPKGEIGNPYVTAGMRHCGQIQPD